jgi:hypothetical protein
MPFTWEEWVEQTRLYFERREKEILLEPCYCDGDCCFFTIKKPGEEWKTCECYRCTCVRLDKDKKIRLLKNKYDNEEYIRQRHFEHVESQREVERMVKRNGVKVYRKKFAHKQTGVTDE